jgi:hypothetical protein
MVGTGVGPQPHRFISVPSFRGGGKAAVGLRQGNRRPLRLATGATVSHGRGGVCFQGLLFCWCR